MIKTLQQGTFDEMFNGLQQNNENAVNTLAEQQDDASQESSPVITEMPIKHITSAQAGSPKLKAPKKKKIYESSISKNVANGQQVKAVLDTLGISYNPSRQALTPVSLAALNVLALQFLENVRIAKQENEEGIDNRKIVYRNLKTLATRILNELKASGASEGVISKAESLVKLIQGQRIIKIQKGETDANHISASHTSYNQMIDHVSRMLLLLASSPEYDPNVVELKLLELTAKRDAMVATNEAVFIASAQYSKAMRERNEFFNAPFSGYVETYLAVKNAVKAIYGARSAEYKQIGKITFKKIRTK